MTARTSMRQAHPRAGGADAAAEDDAGKASGSSRAGGRTLATFVVRAPRGSSPRGQGGRCLNRHPRRHHGAHPARVGRTQLGSGVARHRAHPRAGGADQPTRLRVRFVLLGLIPARAGRTGRRDVPPAGRGGLIPARAGRAPNSTIIEPLARAHPRAGGRGPVKVVTGPSGPGRAHRQAGRTPRLVQSRVVRSAHPRAGGRTTNRAGRKGGVRLIPRGQDGQPRTRDARHFRLIPRGRADQHRLPGFVSYFTRLIPAWAGGHR